MREAQARVRQDYYGDSLQFYAGKNRIFSDAITNSTENKMLSATAVFTYGGEGFIQCGTVI
jgi:hypothetical protein